MDNQAYLKNLTPRVLKNKCCLIGMSVGGHKHYGDKFNATIELLKKLKPKNVTFLVADTLQRHNYIETSKEQKKNIDFVQKTSLGGAKWIKSMPVQEGMKGLKELSINVNILRWEDCVGNKFDKAEYLQSRKTIDALYENNDAFKLSVDITAKKHVEKKTKKGKDKSIVYNSRLKPSINYVLEELAVLKNLGLSGKYDYFIYPNEEITAMKAMREHFITPKFKEKLAWAQLEFRGNGNRKRSKTDALASKVRTKKKPKIQRSKSAPSKLYSHKCQLKKFDVISTVTNPQFLSDFFLTLAKFSPKESNKATMLFATFVKELSFSKQKLSGITSPMSPLPFWNSITPKNVGDKKTIKKVPSVLK